MSTRNGALLFDLDGTLCDTDRLHFGAYCTLLKDFGRSITLEHYKARIMGAHNDVIMREMFPDLDVARHRALADRKEALFRDAIVTLEPTPGVSALLDWADAKGVGVAVVTNAPRANAEMMLKGLGLDRRIGTVVLGEELPRAKPDPLPYATALERLGAGADHALAFEDSLPGIRSASGAGVATYGIRTGHPDDALLGAGAIGAIDDFTDRGLWQRLAAMF
ncbi:MAG TPA: HAD-IA family hydrolase [Dongiaceae bacterium]|jgi:beta-phosphoglucomutase|nr:HAD-IA family hydrolase [Dongiaceae bacterium]